MKKVKLSLENIQGKLSRSEMKKMMAGSGGGGNKCTVCAGYMAACCYANPDCCYDTEVRCCFY